MNRTLVWTFLAVISASAFAATPAATAQTGWHVLQRYQLGGDGGWDDLTLDPASGHLYISRSDRVLVVDAHDGKQIGQIDGLSGVHGITLAPALQRGFISNGHADTVTVFDPATLKIEQTIAIGGHNPDAILYDPFSKRVFTFNGQSNDVSVIDAATGKLLGTIALPGKPEFAVTDRRGHLYDNIEDKHELVEIDPVAMKVVNTWPLQDCEEPSGLAIDVTHHRLFSACQNQTMAVTDADSGKAVARVAIGDGPDGAAFDAQGGLIFSPNGESGTLTVVHEDDADHYSVLVNPPTQTSARTMTLDPQTGRMYLPAARLGERPAPTADHPHPRPTIVPGSFTILVVGR